jgi:hypothetical protein
MIEPGEVNGVRFFKGSIINARPEDADRLIASGKAIVVDEDGNPIDDDTSIGLETGEYSSGTTDEQPDDAPDEQPNEDKGTSPEEMETEK